MVGEWTWRTVSSANFIIYGSNSSLIVVVVMQSSFVTFSGLTNLYETSSLGATFDNGHYLNLLNVMKVYKDCIFCKDLMMVHTFG